MHFKMNRTNGETSKWINSQKNLSLRAGFEEANTFFGTFLGDHKTFGTCKSTGWRCPCLVHPALQVVGGPCHEVHRLYLQPQSDLVVLWLFE